MSLFDMFRKPAPLAEPADPILSWIVQFDKSGREYSYRETQAGMSALFAERHALGRSKPHRVVALVEGEPVEVRVDVG